MSEETDKNTYKQSECAGQDQLKMQKIKLTSLSISSCLAIVHKYTDLSPGGGGRGNDPERENVQEQI